MSALTENILNMTYAPVTDVLSGKLAVDSEVTVRGWIRSRRDSKAGISFLAIYDGSCFDPIQAVVPNELNNYQEEVLKLTTGCSVEVTGKIVESPAKGQDFELAATEVKVVGLVEDPDTYPMAKTRHSIEYLREVAHLRPRTNMIGAVARVRNCLSQAIHRSNNYKVSSGCLLHLSQPLTVKVRVRCSVYQHLIWLTFR